MISVKIPQEILQNGCYASVNLKKVTLDLILTLDHDTWHTPKK